jgi:hypothetical protein
MRPLLFAVFGLALAIGAAGCDDENPDGDADADADTDADADADGDGDGDADGDGDGDGDGDADGDADADADADQVDADLEAGCDTAPGGNPVSDTSTAIRARMAWTGTNAGLLWATQGTAYGESEVYFSLLDDEVGTVVEDTLLAGTGSMDDTPNVELLWDGEQFHVVWQVKSGGDSDLLFHQRVGLDGARIGDSQQLNTGVGIVAWPSIALGNDEVFVTWTDQRSGNSDVYGRAIALDDTLGEELLLSGGSLRQELSSVVFTGTDYLVVFQSEDTPEGIYTLRATGAAAGLPVAAINGVSIIEQPRVVPTGADLYAVMFRTQRGLETRVYFSSVTPDGALVTSPVVVLPNGRVFDAVFDGTNTVMVATQSDYARAQAALWRIGPDGVTIGDHFVVACSSNVSNPTIAWTGEDYYLSWSEPVADDIHMTSRLYAQRVSF